MLPLLILFSLQPESSGLRQLFEERFARERTASSARDLGLYLARHGDPNAARTPLAEALRLSGSASDAIELALVSNAGDAEPLLLQAARDRTLAPRAFDRLGHLYDATGKRDQAITAYRKAIALIARADILEALAQDVPPGEGIPLLRQAAALNRRNLGLRHPQTGTTEANLAGLLLNANQPDESVRVARDALSIFEEALGPDHPRTALAATILAFGLQAKGDRAGAERYFRQTVAIDRAAYGPTHAQTVKDEQTLAEFLAQR